MAAAKLKKVLILGSGGLKIGQAGEFDYSGTQAIKALKEEGIKTVLLNPNIATIQTSEGFADKVYFLPVDEYFCQKIIKKERPEGILLAFGGQTALNVGVALAKSGFLKKNGVKVLGTPIKTITDSEDRDLFKARMAEIGVKVAVSKVAYNLAEAVKIGQGMGFPLMVRAAYCLGGQSSGIVRNESEFRELLKNAFRCSTQVLIEECLEGWKEVEYEVVRDKADNAVTVCNMENLDPMGIHTGESIVVAPSQTLDNREYHYLREIGIRAVRHLGVIGECNIQYAFDPKSGDYRVIEVNARLSRSSALASKATGYPLAYIAAKLALGHTLDQLSNSVTKVTQSFFEPALDYIVVKVPRWDLTKFYSANRRIGSEMKSVGEIMAIGRKFEEALQKALRMLNIGVYGLVANELVIEDPLDEIKNPTDRRVFALAEALRQGKGVEELARISKIDPWFIGKIKNIVEVFSELEKNRLDAGLTRRAKQYGFSDRQVAKIKNRAYMDIRRQRKKWGIVPVVKQIDTLAGEFPARTNYLYMTYNGSENDVQPLGKGAVMVLGGGPYRIGSSVEFDWCGVQAIQSLSKLGKKTIMVNCNPETVSTDYDICDRLFFEELSYERTTDIQDFEQSDGVIVSVGGQMPNALAKRLYQAGVKVLGTSPLDIDRAEDRNRFSALLDKLGVDQPAWDELTSRPAARAFAEKVEYPVLIRPSYVLSGEAMSVSYTPAELEEFLGKAEDISHEHPVVISKFIEGAKEIEVDGVAKKGELMVYAIAEHVENAGVHSGDATIVLPPQKTYLETVRRIKKITRKIISALRITGPFNIQFLAKDNQIKVIECNLRASRSFPFVSKVTKTNFIELAVKLMLDQPVDVSQVRTVDLDYVGVKAPQFSFARLKGVDPIARVEMGSTGEVACFGENLAEAFLKSVLATGFNYPRKAVLLSIGKEINKLRLLDEAKVLQEMGFTIYATEHTAEFLNQQGVRATRLEKISSTKSPNISEYLENGKIDLIINIPRRYFHKEITDGFLMRRRAVDYGIPLISNRQLAKLFIESIARLSKDDLLIKSWEEYN